MPELGGGGGGVSLIWAMPESKRLFSMDAFPKKGKALDLSLLLEVLLLLQELPKIHNEMLPKEL